MTAGRLQLCAALAAALGLAACETTTESLVERGYPRVYAEGYEDGCASGKAAAGGLFSDPQKDGSRYESGDSQYTEGWDAGFAKCRSDMAAMVYEARTRDPSRDK